MMKYILMIMMLLPAYAFAAADVKIDITAKKVVIEEIDGKKVEKLVSVDDVVPGDKLAYSLSFKNAGDQAAENIEIVDPIPDNTTYIVGSAYGPGSDISFSIDGGKSFRKPTMLTYSVDVNGKKEERKASPDLYTHVRWTVKEIGAEKSGTAGFRVSVK